MKKYKHSNELLSEIGKMLGGVNVNIKMYKILKIRMYKIVHFYIDINTIRIKEKEKST